MSTLTPNIEKLVVIGVGLIGGSFALALKAAGCVGAVVGVGRGRLNLEEARNLGVADRCFQLSEAWHSELATADLVLLGTPVGQYEPLLRDIAPHIGQHTIVTDAGSTKQDVIAAARAALPDALSRFVPGHPIAGTDRSGAAAASAELYQQRTVVLTPLPETDPLAAATVAAAWTACGAHVEILEADAHDRIFAAVSHLPHLLAYALVDEFARRPEVDELFRFAGSGFRDFTRIAGSSPEMWRDIALANRPAIAAELQAYRGQLDRILSILESGDGVALAALFANAREARRRWELRRSGAKRPIRNGGANDA